MDDKEITTLGVEALLAITPHAMGYIPHLTAVAVSLDDTGMITGVNISPLDSERGVYLTCKAASEEGDKWVLILYMDPHGTPTWAPMRLLADFLHNLTDAFAVYGGIVYGSLTPGSDNHLSPIPDIAQFHPEAAGEVLPHQLDIEREHLPLEPRGESTEIAKLYHGDRSRRDALWYAIDAARISKDEALLKDNAEFWLKIARESDQAVADEVWFFYAYSQWCLADSIRTSSGLDQLEQANSDHEMGRVWAGVQASKINPETAPPLMELLPQILAMVESGELEI